MGDELPGQQVHRLRGGALAIGSHVVDRLVEAFADQFGPDAVDQRLGEPGVGRRGHPVGQDRPALQVGLTGLVFAPGDEEPRLHALTLGGGVFEVGHEVFDGADPVAADAPPPTGIIDRHDGKATGAAAADLANRDAGKEGRQLVELFALPAVGRMIVALGALDLDAEEHARDLGRRVFG